MQFSWDLALEHDNVAVLLYHKVNKCFVFVKQFRPGIFLIRFIIHFFSCYAFFLNKIIIYNFKCFMIYFFGMPKEFFFMFYFLKQCKWKKTVYKFLCLLKKTDFV